MQTVIVPDGPDVADKWIADRATDGDVVVTADIPLAARVIASGAAALRHNGDVFSTENIGSQLATRDLMADLRAADPLMTGLASRGTGIFKTGQITVFERLEALIRKANHS